MIRWQVTLVSFGKRGSVLGDVDADSRLAALQKAQARWPAVALDVQSHASLEVEKRETIARHIAQRRKGRHG